MNHKKIATINQSTNENKIYDLLMKSPSGKIWEHSPNNNFPNNIVQEHIISGNIQALEQLHKKSPININQQLIQEALSHEQIGSLNWLEKNALLSIMPLKDMYIWAVTCKHKHSYLWIISRLDEEQKKTIESSLSPEIKTWIHSIENQGCCTIN